MKNTSLKTVFSSLQAGKETWPSKHGHLQGTSAGAVQLFRQAGSTVCLDNLI